MSPPLAEQQELTLSCLEKHRGRESEESSCPLGTSKHWPLDMEPEKAEEALVQLLRTAADGEAVLEEMRQRLCRMPDFQIHVWFAAFIVTVAQGDMSLPGCLDIQVLHRWLRSVGSPTMRISESELSRAMLGVAAPKSGSGWGGGVMRYKQFLQLVLPRHPQNSALRIGVLTAPAPTVRKSVVETNVQPLARDCAIMVQRLIEEEVELQRLLRKPAIALTMHLKPEGVFELLRGRCDGGATALSVFEFVTGELGALTPEQAASLFRRLDAAGLGSCGLEEVELLAVPVIDVEAELCRSQKAKVAPELCPASLRELLAALARQGELDAMAEAARARFRARLKPNVNGPKAVFELLDRGSKGYVTVADIWQRLEEAGRSVPMSDLRALRRNVMSGDGSLAALGPLPTVSAESRFSLRDVCALVLPTLSEELMVARGAPGDAEALSELYLLSRTTVCPGCGTSVQRSSDTVWARSATCTLCGATFCCRAMASDREPRCDRSWHARTVDSVELDVGARASLYEAIELAAEAAVEAERTWNALRLGPAFSKDPAAALREALRSLGGNAVDSGLDGQEGAPLALRWDDLHNALHQHGFWKSRFEVSLIWLRVAGDTVVSIATPVLLERLILGCVAAGPRMTGKQGAALGAV